MAGPNPSGSLTKNTIFGANFIVTTAQEMNQAPAEGELQGK